MIRTWPRLVGRRLQTDGVIAGNGWSGSPNLSRLKGCTCHSIFGARLRRIALREGAQLGRGHGEGPRPEEEVLESHHGLAEQAVGALVQRPGIPNLVHEPDLEMVVEVLADPRQRVEDRDAVRLQEGAGPDAGELEDLRRSDGAGSEHDLPPRRHEEVEPSPRRISTPAARGPPAPRSTATRRACTSVSTVRFGRCRTGVRKARTMLTRTPRRWFTWK